MALESQRDKNFKTNSTGCRKATNAHTRVWGYKNYYQTQFII